MGNMLREVFSNEIDERTRAYINEIRAEALERRKSIRLAQDKECTGLYISKKPFEWLIYPDDTGMNHLGELSINLAIPTVALDIPGLHSKF